MHTYKLNNLTVTEMSWESYQRKKRVKLMQPINEEFERLKEEYFKLKLPKQ